MDAKLNALAPEWEDMYEEEQEKELVFKCSWSIGSIAPLACPDNPDSCKEEEFGSFFEQQWESYTEEEKNMW